MSNYTITKDAFKINLSPRERRALARRGLSIERTRLVSAQLAEFPEKLDLGLKVPKNLLFGGVFGEYRANTKKILVLGNTKGSEPCLKIRISHPNIDEIWVCGSKAAPLQKELDSFIRPRVVI